ncbi:hypothetical protein VNO80_33057 [Phaseolus coccineus]|uniref:Uncharacterized protein n=1 Tax=Phaseolus coccineus TaxID=3886 RepID=A0AAN9L1A0_PHACN
MVGGRRSLLSSSLKGGKSKEDRSSDLSAVPGRQYHVPASQHLEELGISLSSRSRPRSRDRGKGCSRRLDWNPRRTKTRSLRWKLLTIGLQAAKAPELLSLLGVFIAAGLDRFTRMVGATGAPTIPRSLCWLLARLNLNHRAYPFLDHASVVFGIEAFHFSATSGTDGAFPSPTGLE